MSSVSEDKNWSTPFSVEMTSISKPEYDCLTAAEHERDSLKQQIVERDAVCAAMREALDITLSALPCALLCAEKMPDGSCALDERPCKIEQAKQRIIKALSSDAGKDLLERMRLLEAVKDAANRSVEVSRKYNGDPNNIVWENEAVDAEKALENTLAAVDAFLKRGEKE